MEAATTTGVSLVHEFTYVAQLVPPMDLGPGPHGRRMIVGVTGAEVRGERISGRMVGPGADWLLAGADGWGSVDVRGQIETSDGALLYLEYVGHLEMNDAVQAAMGGHADTSFADQYFRTTPRLSTGDERYAWVNRTVFVGEGRVLANPFAVEYRVYRVT